MLSLKQLSSYQFPKTWMESHPLLLMCSWKMGDAGVEPGTVRLEESSLDFALFTSPFLHL